MIPIRTSGIRKDKRSLRLSASPGKSPVVMEAQSLPARSIQLEEDESGTSQLTGDSQDPRMTEFLEIPSDDDLALDTSLEDFTPELDTASPILEVRHGTSIIQPSNAGVRLDEIQEETVLPSLKQRFAMHRDTPSTSFHESVDELIAANDATTSRFSKASEQTQRSSESYRQQTSATASAYPRKAEQVLGAHLLAHEITLQALMRDEDVIDRSLQSIATANGANFRASLLPPSLRFQEPRVVGNRNASASQHSSKKVQVIPPPIDTSGARNSLPIDFIPTPYPFSNDQTDHRDTPSNLSPSHQTPAPHQRILLLRLRGPNPTSPKQRSTTLIIPPSNHFSIARASRPGGRPSSPHPTPSFFDDEDLFQQFRLSYKNLSGNLRLLSARSLRRVVVNRSSGAQVDPAAALTPLLRLPPGARIVSTEDELLSHFHSPSRSRGKYHFVRWAYQLAEPVGVEPARVRGFEEGGLEAAELESEGEGKGLGDRGALSSLDFVVDWSVYRIGLAIGTVVVLSVLAALLWIFLGTQTSPVRPSEGGFRGAEDRVGSGMVLGVAVWLTGLSVFAGWIGLSWVVM